MKDYLVGRYLFDDIEEVLNRCNEKGYRLSQCSIVYSDPDNADHDIYLVIMELVKH